MENSFLWAKVKVSIGLAPSGGSREGPYYLPFSVYRGHLYSLVCGCNRRVWPDCWGAGKPHSGQEAALSWRREVLQENPGQRVETAASQSACLP